MSPPPIAILLRGARVAVLVTYAMSLLLPGPATAQFALQHDPPEWAPGDRGNARAQPDRSPTAGPAASAGQDENPGREAIAAAELLYRGDKRQAALAAFQQIVERDPAHAQAWLRLGNLHQLRGDIAGAARAYRRAADLPMRPGEPTGVRGKALLNLAMLGLIRARQALAELDADGVPASLAPARDDARRRLERFEVDLEQAIVTGGAARDAASETPVDTDTARSAAAPTVIRIERDPDRRMTPASAARAADAPRATSTSASRTRPIAGAGASRVQGTGVARPVEATGAETTASVGPDPKGAPVLIVGRPEAASGGPASMPPGPGPARGEGSRADTARAAADPPERVRIEYLDGGRSR